VPDDRFADLGPGTSAGERLADLDRREPERPPEPPRRRGRYSWVVGVAFVILIAVVVGNTIGHEREGSNGLAAGARLPRFAAPIVSSSLEGDPNIKQSAQDDSVGNHTPACQVADARAVRSCDLVDRPLVITFIVPTSECEAYLDRVDRLRSRFSGVNFLAVISGSRSGARTAVREHSWGEPVVSDDNGALLTLFRAPPYCATTVFANRGGIVRTTKTSAQQWSDERLAAAIRATEAR